MNQHDEIDYAEIRDQRDQLEKEQEAEWKASEHFRSAEESFDRCDTDGFLTQWAHGLNGRLEKRKAELARNGGMATFRGLYDRETGERVAAKLIEGRYGYCWAFCDADGNFTGRFLGDSKGTPRSRMYREGFESRTEDAPANAVLQGAKGATGLSGAHTVGVVVYRTDGGYPEGAKVLS
jgi:hypothetical protein